MAAFAVGVDVVSDTVQAANNNMRQPINLRDSMNNLGYCFIAQLLFPLLSMLGSMALATIHASARRYLPQSKFFNEIVLQGSV
jgi:hypothetical protein